MKGFRQFGKTNELKPKHENIMASSRFPPTAICKDGMDSADGQNTRWKWFAMQRNGAPCTSTTSVQAQRRANSTRHKVTFQFQTKGEKCSRTRLPSPAISSAEQQSSKAAGQHAVSTILHLFPPPKHAASKSTHRTLRRSQSRCKANLAPLRAHNALPWVQLKWAWLLCWWLSLSCDQVLPENAPYIVSWIVLHGIGRRARVCAWVCVACSCFPVGLFVGLVFVFVFFVSIIFASLSCSRRCCAAAERIRKCPL